MIRSNISLIRPKFWFFLEFECSGNCKGPGSAGVPAGVFLKCGHDARVPGKAGKFAIIPIPKFKEEPKFLCFERLKANI